MDIPVSMSLLPVHRGGEGVSIPPDQHIKERQLGLLFNLHCELDLLTEIVQMIQEGDQLGSAMGPYDEGVIHVPEPELWLSVRCYQCRLLEVFHEQPSDVLPFGKNSIIDRSERATAKEAYRLKNLEEKLARYGNHLTFLMRCRNHNIVPRGLLVPLPVNTAKAQHIAWRTAKALLRERIKEVRQQKLHLKKQVATQIGTPQTLSDDTGTCRRLEQWARWHGNRVHEKVKERQRKKFDNLMQGKRWGQRTNLDKNRLVVNLSSQQLTEAQRDVLALGLNFATTPKRIPVEDIIARTEHVCMWPALQECN